MILHRPAHQQSSPLFFLPAPALCLARLALCFACLLSLFVLRLFVLPALACTNKRALAPDMSTPGRKKDCHCGSSNTLNLSGNLQSVRLYTSVKGLGIRGIVALTRSLSFCFSVTMRFDFHIDSRDPFNLGPCFTIVQPSPGPGHCVQNRTSPWG